MARNWQLTQKPVPNAQEIGAKHDRHFTHHVHVLYTTHQSIIIGMRNLHFPYTSKALQFPTSDNGIHSIIRLSGAYHNINQEGICLSLPSISSSHERFKISYGYMHSRQTPFSNLHALRLPQACRATLTESLSKICTWNFYGESLTIWTNLDANGTFVIQLGR